MSIASQSAARHICARGNWGVTNLALQKILYMAHMVHLGRTGQRLVEAEFQAWDYGPVEPNLYRQVRMFGNRAIQDIFYFAAPVEGTAEAATLDEACQYLISKSPGELVAMTHWQQGAWARHYVPGARAIPIPDADIIAEYRARTATPQ
ncbi:Panacea domain-containing protein [Tardiphaga sp. P5_C7]